jgi:hypothetical protein
MTRPPRITLGTSRAVAPVSDRTFPWIFVPIAMLAGWSLSVVDELGVLGPALFLLGSLVMAVLIAALERRLARSAAHAQPTEPSDPDREHRPEPGS